MLYWAKEYFRPEFAPICSFSINSWNFPTRSSDALLGNRVSLDQNLHQYSQQVRLIFYKVIENLRLGLVISYTRQKCKTRRLLKSSTIYTSHEAAYKLNIVTLVTLLNPYLTQQTCPQRRLLICIIDGRLMPTVPEMIRTIAPHSENAL